MRASRLLSSAGLLMVGIGLGMAIMAPRAPQNLATDVVLPPANVARAPEPQPVSVTAVPDQSREALLAPVAKPAADDVAVTTPAPPATKAVPSEPGRDGLFSPAGSALSSTGALIDGSGAAKPTSSRIADQAVSEAAPSAEPSPKPATTNAARARKRIKAVKTEARPANRQASHNFENPLGVR